MTAANLGCLRFSHLGFVKDRGLIPARGQAEDHGSAVLGPRDDADRPGEMEGRLRLPRGAFKLGPAHLSL